MNTYRTQVKIVADVLSTTKDFGESEDGVGVAMLLRKANLSYSRLVIMLKDLVDSGLLLELEQQRGNRYRISERGIQFLQAYSRFEEFAHAYGLRI